jgi:hypothetical protein
MTKLQLDPFKHFKYDLSVEKDFKKTNNLTHAPKGIVIFDSYNNPFYPMELINLDSAKFTFNDIKMELKRKNWQGYFTPWHYWIELVGTDYIAIQSRPITYKTPLPGYEDYIAICIAGNTKNDIYMQNIYKCITDIVINQFHYIRCWAINAADHTVLLNLGKNFEGTQLEKMFK